MREQELHSIYRNEKGEYLEFFAAECSEIPSLGKYYQSVNLKEIANAYRQICAEEKRLGKNMGNGMGIVYHETDGSEWPYTIIFRDLIDGKGIESVSMFCESPMVHQAVEDIHRLFPDFEYLPPPKLKSLKPVPVKHRAGGKKL